MGNWFTASEPANVPEEDIITLLKQGNCHALYKKGSPKSALAVDELKGKIVGVYFSAHWVRNGGGFKMIARGHDVCFLLGQCPPCRGFTPVLKKLYEDCNKQQKPFEVIFISSDQVHSSILPVDVGL